MNAAGNEISYLLHVITDLLITSLTCEDLFHRRIRLKSFKQSDNFILH